MPDHFKTNRFSVRVKGREDSVSAESYEPANPKAVLTLAHGAGTNMDHAFMKELASGLARHDFIVVRFNFVYTELKKKMPDRFPVASSTVRSVINECHGIYEGLPLFCCGKSFGGRMTSMTLAEESPDFVKGIVFYGFPLHPPDSPSVERAEHLKNVYIPMLFLQGTKDTLAYFDLISTVTSSLANSTLESFEGVDHSFRKGKQVVIPELINRTVQWVNNHL